jgi:hypothetical protein
MVNHARESGSGEAMTTVLGRSMPLFACLALSLAATAQDGLENELLATPELLAAVRAEIRKPGTHHRQVYETMKARVDASYPDNAALSTACYGPQAGYGLRSLDR